MNKCGCCGEEKATPYSCEGGCKAKICDDCYRQVMSTPREVLCRACQEKPESPPKPFCPIGQAGPLIIGKPLRHATCPQTKEGGCQLWNEHSHQCAFEGTGVSLAATSVVLSNLASEIIGIRKLLTEIKSQTEA